MKKLWQNIKALFQKSETEKTSLQKTARLSLILFGVAVIALVLWFAVISPMIRTKTERIPDLFPGEVYENKSIYILRKIDRSEITAVEIKNDYGTYRLDTYQMQDGSQSFLMNTYPGHELNQDTLATLLGDVRILITNSPAGMDRVNDRATAEDLAHYGLDEASDPAWFRVSLKDGTSYRILVGNSLATSRGYYAILEGRKNTVTEEDGTVTEYDIVYAMQSGISTSVLAEETFLISKQMAPSYGNSIYAMADFAITRLGKDGKQEMVTRIGLVETPGISASSSTYRMIYPSAYIVNEDIYGKVLSTLMYFSADSIVAYGEKIYQPEVYEKFGLDLDFDRLADMTAQNHAILYLNPADESVENYEDYATTLLFSERVTEIDGADYYYVYAPALEVIGKVLATEYEFIDWRIGRFTNEYLYYEYFTSAEFIEIVSERDNLDIRFTFSGKENDRRAVATVSGEDGAPFLVKDADGNMVPLIYDTKYKLTNYGVDFDGEFENLRDLYYVLITRRLALNADVDETMTRPDSEPTRFLRVKTSPKDHPLTYYLYDSNGNKKQQVRDQGCNILCTNVVTVIKRSDGSETTMTYPEAYYDLNAKKFFRKASDTNDGVVKPMSCEADANGYVKVTTYLSENTTGEYSETIFEYEFYDLYDEYVNIDGDVVRQLNPTYTYVVPTTKTLTYRVSAGGARELISEKTVRAEEGLYIRCAALDKLFSDTNKLLAGEPIDTMGLN